MRCNHCGQNEATNRFIINHMGVIQDMFLCDACMGELLGGAMAPGFGGEAMRFGPWDDSIRPLRYGLRPESGKRVMVRERDDFPLNAGEDIRRRRTRAALKSRLQSAVEKEDYEAAAKLRDELYRMEKGA
jgi:protein-arginine kinase activator protein McsA